MKRLTALFLALALCLSLCTVTAFAETTTYTVTIDDTIQHGKVTATLTDVASGTNVTLTVTPENDYQLKSLTVTPVAPPIAGALKGEFSVSATKKVYFSQGNLVATIDATGDPTAWKFAANQYDYLGEGGANKTIGNTAGDVDLFGWSTSTNEGTSTTDNYGIQTSFKDNDYSGDFYDWGKAVGDGSTWRTLSKDEWTYLFKTRTVNGGTGAGKSYSLNITYGGKMGVVLYPDDYTGSVLSGTVDSLPEGVVFLPAAGYRNGSSVSEVGAYGCYWSSTIAGGSGNAHSANFESDGVWPDSMYPCYYGYSVRLVTSVPAAPETITPAEQQNGTYQFTMPAANVTVTAEFVEDDSPTPDDHDVDYEKLAKAGMVAAGVVAGVVVTKIVVDKLHEIKAAKDAAAEAVKAVEMPMVAFGDSGDAVTTLQTELNAQGYACGEADGIFGQNTLNAVIAFQTAKGLTADGVVGAQTWGALL